MSNLRSFKRKIAKAIVEEEKLTKFRKGRKLSFRERIADAIAWRFR